MYAESNELGYAILTQGENGLAGFIQNRSEVYRLEPIGEGIHVITKLNMQKRANREKDFQDYKENKKIPKSTSSTESTSVESTTVVNIIIAYTLNAKNDCPDNIRDWARNAVWAAENTYLNSGVPIDLNLVYLYLTQYSESGSMQTDLNNFESSTDPYMNEIHTFYSQYDADICVLMVSNNEYNGLVNHLPALGYDEAFLIVNYDAASSQWSLAHEMGHLIGARHQYQADKSLIPVSYCHASFANAPNNDQNGGWRTVMATRDMISSFSLIRIPYYSDPDAYYGGILLGESTYRDNVRNLTERRSIIANLMKQKYGTQNSKERSPEFELMQNYPNPFNPSTSISFSLQKDCFVTLKIFNNLGREVCSLMNDFQAIGNHSVQFDGSNLPSGMYYYRLDAGEFSSTKKLILLK